MVFGTTRVRPRSTAPLPLVSSGAGADAAWLSDRGTILCEGTADLYGSFPGFLEHGGQRCGAQLRISERYLLVGEGLENGFGMPAAALAGGMLATSPSRDEPQLHVFYRHAGQLRQFAVSFRPNRLA